MYQVSIVFISAILGWKVLPFAGRKFQVAILKRKCRMSKVIVLTFDDGLGAGVTEKIMALLKAFDVPATIFMLGKKIATDSGCHKCWFKRCIKSVRILSNI